MHIDFILYRVYCVFYILVDDYRILSRCEYYDSIQTVLSFS